MGDRVVSACRHLSSSIHSNMIIYTLTEWSVRSGDGLFPVKPCVALLSVTYMRSIYLSLLQLTASKHFIPCKVHGVTRVQLQPRLKNWGYPSFLQGRSDGGGYRYFNNTPKISPSKLFMG